MREVFVLPFTLFAAADPSSPQPCRFGFTRTAEWQSEAARKDAAATTASRGESVNQHTSPTSYPLPAGLQDVLQRKDSSLLRKDHFIELAALWGYKSDVWRLRPLSGARRRHMTPPADHTPCQKRLLSPPQSPPDSLLALSQLPAGLEAQLRASASAYMDLPAGEQAFAFLRLHAAIDCEILSQHFGQATLLAVQAQAGGVAANLAQLRASAAAMTAAELAEPLAWMDRSHELSRLLDEHLMVAYASVAANRASMRCLRMASETVCDQAYLGFIQKSNGDLARFLCQAQCAMALMRQDTCGGFSVCCCLVGELLVDVLNFLAATMQLQLSCVEARAASAPAHGSRTDRTARCALRFDE